MVDYYKLAIARPGRCCCNEVRGWSGILFSGHFELLRNPTDILRGTKRRMRETDVITLGLSHHFQFHHVPPYHKPAYRG
jgi:hypothetical protein